MPDTQGIFTLADYTSLVGSQQAHPIVVDTIRDCMPLFDQATIQPANDGTNNKTDLITKYPEGQLRGFNQGVEPEKAEGKTVTDSCMLVSTYSQIDEKLLQLNKNSATWRANKERAFMRGLAYGMAKRFFYGFQPLLSIDGTGRRNFNGRLNASKKLFAILDHFLTQAFFGLLQARLFRMVGKRLVGIGFLVCLANLN